MSKKTLTLFLLLLTPLLTSYGQYKMSEAIPTNVFFPKNEIPENFNNYYEGIVDNKYPISISINNVDDNLTAVYSDYYQKDAIQVYGHINFLSANYIDFYAYGLRNAAKSHDNYSIMKVVPYDAQNLIITSHYLKEAINTKLTLKNYPENYTYIKKINTAEFIEQAKITTTIENEYTFQDLHKTQWQYPTISHTNPAIEKKINQKIEALVVHSVEDFKTVQEELTHRQLHNLQTTLEERITYSNPNMESWDILINSLPPDSLHYTIHNVQVPYIANNILQLNSNAVNWSGDLVNLEYETKLIDTQSGDYITFEQCFHPKAKEIIYTYLFENYWKPEQLNKQLVDKMFGINNYGISYQFYEPPIPHVELKANNITVPFKLLNKYIKADGPLGVFKRKK